MTEGSSKPAKPSSGSHAPQPPFHPSRSPSPPHPRPVLSQPLPGLLEAANLMTLFSCCVAPKSKFADEALISRAPSGENRRGVVLSRKSSSVLAPPSPSPPLPPISLVILICCKILFFPTSQAQDLESQVGTFIQQFLNLHSGRSQTCGSGIFRMMRQHTYAHAHALVNSSRRVRYFCREPGQRRLHFSESFPVSCVFMILYDSASAGELKCVCLCVRACMRLRVCRSLVTENSAHRPCRLHR
jgi:hypothetical protein